MALLQPDATERQYVWDDLETLKSKVLHARPLDPILRAWSAGVVEDKSFSQLTEEFARMVIPKVWEREGRKISRVAEKLSISPKKVRRILHSAGMHKIGVGG
jgi:DNA-binding NtrC family response regulator